MPGQLWTDLAWTDFQSRDMARTIAVLPVAAIEQHGPHLPVGVDTIIGQGHVDAALSAVPADLDVLFLPVQAVGKSNEHLAFPGTITLGWETATRAWIEIGESVARAGCRKLLIITSHGGNVPVIDIVARELRVRCSMLAVASGWHSLADHAALPFSARERSHGLHAGDYETSLMMHLRPGTVKPGEAVDFPSRGEIHDQRFGKLRVTRPVGFGWMSQDLHPSGAVGEAHLASAERGLQALESAVAGFVQLVRDMDAFDLAGLSSGPLG
jgi:creatinine amidohydrolase